MNNAADAQCTQHDLKSFKSCESSLTLININIEPLNKNHAADAQRTQHDLNQFISC